MEPEEFISDIGMHLLRCVAEERYTDVVEATGGRQYTVEDIEFALSEYPYKPILPPAEHAWLFRCTPMSSPGNELKWLAGVPVCTAEEGRSDLELQLVLDFATDPPDVQLLAIRVP